eukprot:COSAG01_NODE_40057_length_468_cov_0.978320_1_plen_77_part_10
MYIERLSFMIPQQTHRTHDQILTLSSHSSPDAPYLSRGCMLFYTIHVAIVPITSDAKKGAALFAEAPFAARPTPEAS